jgi:UMF1 family MFS transporter
MGKVSGYGFAFGYLGGIIALVIMLLLLAENESGKTLIGLTPLFGLDAAAREGTRSVGPFTAIWFVVFMVPFFLWVREVPRAATGAGKALRSLGALIRDLPRRPSLFAHLMSSMIYRDSLNALYAFGGVYAAGVLGWSITQIGVFGIAGALAAAVFSWIGGRADSARGPKPVMVVSIWVLIAVCLVIAGMTPERIYGMALPAGMADKIFYLCGMLIGAAGGTLQSSSRTMMVFHTTPDHATEGFGLYALSGKVTSFIAPAGVALATTLSGSQRIGIAIPLILLFLLGMVLLTRVNAKGERA